MHLLPLLAEVCFIFVTRLYIYYLFFPSSYFFKFYISESITEKIKGKGKTIEGKLFASFEEVCDLKGLHFKEIMVCYCRFLFVLWIIWDRRSAPVVWRGSLSKMQGNLVLWCIPPSQPTLWMSDPHLKHSQLPKIPPCRCLQENFTETLYRYDEDGYQSYCTVCCAGLEVILCGNASCCRYYLSHCDCVGGSNVCSPTLLII